MNTHPDILNGHICPYCGDRSVHTSDRAVYTTGFGGMIYWCKYCDAYVGCHKHKPTESKGRLADKELRSWKILAHQYFDGMWKAKKSVRANVARSQAYRWLAVEMDIQPEYCHIGMFDVEECKQVVDICKFYYN